jgi:hypothetical protein
MGDTAKLAASWAEFERASGKAAADRAPGRAAFWLIYPLTLLECALMAVGAALSHVLWRVAYCSWWFPEASRRPPAHLVKPKIDVADSLAAMQTVERLARESGAQAFWISGTLLGLERLGHPLPHDKDLDVGIDIRDPRCDDFIRALWASEAITSLVPQFLSRKMRMQNPDLACMPAGLIRYKAAVAIEGRPGRPPVVLDVFLHFPYRGGYMHGTRNSLWWNTTQGVARKSWRGVDFSVPVDPHLYLTENYGDYAQEVKEFENSIDCPNALDVFCWKSWAYLVSRQRAMLKLGRVRRAAQVNARLRSTIAKGLVPVDPARPVHLGS